MLELGLSWEYLERDEEEVLECLVGGGGFPRAVAREVVYLAACTATQSQTPLALFWDLDRLPLPSSYRVNSVLTRLSAVLFPHRTVRVIRAYLAG